MSDLQTCVSAGTVLVVRSAPTQSSTISRHSAMSLLIAVTCAGPQISYQPMALSFTTVLGEQLLAFHKPTTPLKGIALYEDVMEPGLRAGVIAISS